MNRLPSKDLWREYESEYDEEFYQFVLQILMFITKHIGQGELHTGDVLALMLDELTAYYESLATWLAKQRAALDTAKTEYEIQFATTYMAKKEANQTNETARHMAKLETIDKKREIDRLRKAWLLIEALKKSIAHYIDSIRSQLSYEKQMQQYSGGRQG